MSKRETRQPSGRKGKLSQAIPLSSLIRDLKKALETCPQIHTWQVYGERPRLCGKGIWARRGLRDRALS